MQIGMYSLTAVYMHAAERSCVRCKIVIAVVKSCAYGGQIGTDYKSYVTTGDLHERYNREHMHICILPHCTSSGERGLKNVDRNNWPVLSYVKMAFTINYSLQVNCRISSYFILIF